MRGFLVAAVLTAGCASTAPPGPAARGGPAPELHPSPPVVAAARAQVGDLYDASYRRIGYPDGDVPAGRGACTDVVVRAFRAAGKDLQKLVHEDAERAPAAYPRIAARDRNIDHRRCPNLVSYLRRHGTEVPQDGKWEPGDIVFWKLPGGLDHVGIVSDRQAAPNRPFVIHNIGGCAEDDSLFRWQVVGHFRLP